MFKHRLFRGKGLHKGDFCPLPFHLFLQTVLSLFTFILKYGSMEAMKRIFLLMAALFVSVCTSCSKIIGYSVVLWTIPERQIADGSVVGVYVKSSISKEYIIRVPDSDEKFSVPLWKLSEPESKKKAAKRAETYAPFAQTYARCVLDGLPIRESSRTVAKQVYRLRKDEVIRVLSRGEGEIPTNGSEQFTGEWLSVLTSDGTRGWCFSQNLSLFEMAKDGTYQLQDNASGIHEIDAQLESLLSAVWYPDYYAPMIRNKEVDLRYIKAEYGFDTGSTSGKVSLTLPDVTMRFPFAGVTRIDAKTYKFNETPIQVTVRNEASLAVKYTDERGMPFTKNFITLETAISEVITAEEERREQIYTSLRAFGPVFKSSSYGTLTFTGGSAFSWTGFSLLVPSVISAGASAGGTVTTKYFLPKNLSASWDGLLSFQFDGQENEVHFLYKKEANGLRLCVARVFVQTDSVTGRDDVHISRPSGAAVLFFLK